MIMIILEGYVFYMLVALVGISIGYHRYFTHNSFKANSYIEILMLFSGLICGNRSVLTWAGVHRMHHAHSDTKKDPHSPTYLGIPSVLFSTWSVTYMPGRYITDLMKNPRVVFFHRYGNIMYAIYCISILLYGLTAFYIFVVSPFVMAWLGFGLLNYIAHKDGEAKDIPMLNVIGLGEGWHKYHHAHPGATSLNKYDIAGVLIEVIRTK